MSFVEESNIFLFQKKNRLGTMTGSFGHYFLFKHYSDASRALAWRHPSPPPRVLKHLQLLLSQQSLLVLVACSLPVSITFLWLLQLAVVPTVARCDESTQSCVRFSR